MGAQEAPAGKKAGKASGKKVDADALKRDVQAFASQLGLVSAGAGDDAFSDFAPSKAKQSIAPGSKPNKRQRLNDNEPAKGQAPKASVAAPQRHEPPTQKEAGSAKAAGRKFDKKNDKVSSEDQHAKQRAGKQPSTKQAAPHAGGSSEEAAQGDAKGRDWNFGVGPRPGEAKGFKSLLGKSESSVWHKAAAALPAAAAATAAPSSQVDPDLFERRRAAAEALMEAEAAAFEKELHRRNPSDAKWLLQVKRAGTSSDKLAASTLLVQESVVANMKALDQLVTLATKRSGGKELVRQAMEALQELFTNVLLPDRKLKFLEQQPLQDLPSGRDGEKQLLLWWTEDCVKRRYALFVGALEEHSKDNLEFLKEKSMKVMSELLSAKPECEARLLAALVNKLGDPSRQVASKGVYLLMQLLATHPVMKPVVVREVERFVFRPGLVDKARYYAVVFLNQVPLSHRASEGGDALAKQLISLYFTLFRMVVEGHIGAAAQLRKKQEEKYAEEKKKFWREQRSDTAQRGRGGRGGRRGRGGRGGRGHGNPPRPPPPPKFAAAEEVDARLLSGLITGVRRAFPYVKPEDVEPLVEESATQMFRLVYTAPFTVAVQSLMLMYQLMSARAAISDRYYRALYAALNRDGPTTSSRAPMFLALLFKAMQGDVSVKRVGAFAKRLLQLATAAQPNWACGALLLVSQVLAAQPALWASITHPEDVGGSGVEEFKDPDEGLLEDADDDDVEQFRDHDDGSEGDADGDAELAGVKLDLDGARRRTNALASTSGRGAAAAPGSLAAKAAEAKAKARAVEAQAEWPQPSYYQMDKREPLFANADRSCWWELTALAAHAHPSVSAMARSLLSGAPVVFDGDPLRDLSLAAFLDKFVNKKPKPVTRVKSVMQPTAAPLGGALEPSAAGGKKQKQQQSRAASLAKLSRDAFAAMAEAEVDAADMFFHKFLNLKGVKDKRAARAGAKAAKKSREGGERDEEESLSGAEDDEVDRYLEKQEGMADDAFGDPDMGYDYDQLAQVLEEGGLSDADDEDLGGDEEDEEGAQEGEDEEEDDGEGAGSGSGSDAGSEGSLEDVNVLDLPSPSADDEPEEESDEAAAAARRKRHREAMKAAGVSEADLEALSSDDDEDEDDEVEEDGEDEDGEEEDDEEEDAEGGDSEGDGDDEELMRLLAGDGSDDDGDEDVVMDEANGGGSDMYDDDDDDGDDEDDAEPPQLVPLGGRNAKAGVKAKDGGKAKAKEGGKGAGRGGGKGGNLFASADDYEALIERMEKEGAGGGAGGGGAGEGRRGRGRGGGRGRGRGGGDGGGGGRGFGSDRGAGAGRGRGRGGADGRGGRRGRGGRGAGFRRT